MILPCTCLLLEVCVFTAIAILFFRAAKKLIENIKLQRRRKK